MPLKRHGQRNLRFKWITKQADPESQLFRGRNGCSERSSNLPRVSDRGEMTFPSWAWNLVSHLSSESQLSH